MEIAALILAGVFAAWVLIKVWQAGAGTEVEPEVKRDQVRARVVPETAEPDEVALLTRYLQITNQKAQAQAYAAEAKRVIDRQSQEVRLPWGWPPPDKLPTEPPKV